LVKHFKHIEGIVSEYGGLLSHLAILAREQEKPVVVTFFPKRENIQVGDKIKIDGSNGNIEKI
jgi:pyruvate,water dikinase